MIYYSSSGEKREVVEYVLWKCNSYTNNELFKKFPYVWYNNLPQERNVKPK